MPLIGAGGCVTFLPRATVTALLLSTALSTVAAAQSSALPSDPASWRTPEYLAQWGLDYVNAAKAYARGVDGTGVLVGVIDSGIFAAHSEFIGRYAGGYDYPTETAQPIDQSGHGTSVSSVIAANRDGTGMHGVAPGAMLVVAGTELELGFTESAFAARAYGDLQARGVRIINNSYGDDRPITAFTRDSYLSEYGPNVAAYQRAVAAGVLSVWGTANDGRNEPSADAALPNLFPELERGWLAVTAVGPGYQAMWANQCGVAKNWCLAAPGGSDWQWNPVTGSWEWPDSADILVAGATGGYKTVWGTSFAAPHVSGAAALVWQMFPFFTADQVRQTLLGTALDIGPPGVDEIFGYGLLDAGKAVLGPGRFDWGDFVVEQPGGVAFFENDIVGAGGLVKRGAGELVLTGHSAYLGATRVEGGFLSVMGSIASPTSIAPAGTLAGTGVINGHVDNAGAVWAGDRRGVGTLTINGNYVQQTGGFLVQQLDASGGRNHLAVTGTATLGGQVAMVRGPQLLPRFLSMPVLSAGQGLVGRFDGVEGPAGDGSAPFIQASLRYEPNTAHLDIRTLPFDAPSVCASANQCAVGSALEHGLAGADAELRKMAELLQAAGTRDGARAALASLSGDAHAGLGTLALNGFSPFGSMIAQRLTALRSGQAEPTAGNAAMAYASNGATSPAVALLRGLPGGQTAPWGEATASHNAWLRGYGLAGRIGGDANAGSADYRAGGAIGGFDRQVTPSLLLGLSLGLSTTDADFRQFAGKGSIKTYEAALYGSYGSGPLRLDGILGFAHLDIESKRSISFGGPSRQAEAEYGAKRFTGAIEAAYAVDLGWSTIEPLAGLRYTYLRQEGFAETGAGSIGLTADGQAAASLLGSIGLRLARQLDLGAHRVAIEARGRWQHEFLDDAMVLDTAFIGSPGASFAVQGAQVARDSAILGVGLSTRASRNLVLFADYDVQLNADATAHAVTAGLRATW